MDQQELDNFKRWFSEYCRSFYTSDQADQKNIILKEEHTLNVVGNMAEISRHLGLNAADSTLAAAIALFHDVGRFPQYARYKTFRDSISTNHAALGAAVLIEHEVLSRLPKAERDAIIRAVTLHNVFAVPDHLDADTLRWVKMIRDADKLDIWRVFVVFYAQQDEHRPNAVSLGLPDTEEYSAQVLSSVFRREMVHLTSLRTLNDFRLLQLAWVFDLNFTRSLEMLLERSYIDGLAANLPRTAEVRQVVDTVRGYVDIKVRSGKYPDRDGRMTAP
jgi:putative nucleotidyltransferase with HDIG domain